MKTLSRRGLFGGACLACGGAHLGLTATPVQAQQQQQGTGWNPPPSSQRCPSRFGPEDTRGHMNLITDQTRQAAARLIRTGGVVELGRRLEPSMAFFGTRRFDVHLKRSSTPPSSTRNSFGGNEEVVVGEIGHVGTQFDAFPHIQIGDEIYNCNKPNSFATRGGFTRMGVDGVGTVFTRGVLIDVAGAKGQQTLPINYEITVADLEEALRRQGGTELRPGDAVLVNTGWGHHWARDNAQYVRGCPGLGVAAAEWLISRQPVLLGSDNWPVEVAPNPDPNLYLPVHQIALVVNGVHLLENMKLDELAERRAHEFAFMVQPLKIAGGTGSTVAPSALL
jgi:kynurenine formamidase